jgi:uncharacterized protein YaaQ
MKIIKTVVIGIIFTILWNGAGFAQPAQPPRQQWGQQGGPQGGPPGGPQGGPQGEQYLALLQERLQLEEKQVEQIRTLLEEFTQQQQALFQKYQGQGDQKDREAERAEMQRLQEAFDTQLAEILTKEQLQEYQKIQAEFQNPNEQYLLVLKERLKLTDTQVEQIRTLLEEQTQQREVLFQKNQGQGDQKDRETERAEMQRLQEAFDTQLAEILTKDQLQEYQRFLKERQQMRPPRRN